MKHSHVDQLFLVLVTTLAVASSPSWAKLLPGEGIAQNPNGDYVITYMSPEEQRLEQTLYVPANKVNPLLKSRLYPDRNGKIVYRYTIINRRDSQQALAGMILDPVTSVTSANGKIDYTALAQPAGWLGGVDANSNGTYRIWWLLHGGVAIGQSSSGLGFASADLPGVQKAELDGFGVDATFIGEPNADIVALYDQLVKNTSFVTRPAAVPAIAVPSPFNAAMLLGSIQGQMHSWITMNLLDASFSAQLDRYFLAAINAYIHNQPKAGKENIEELRKMLKREHEDLDRENERAEERDHDNDTKHDQIDLLAARVLDFDLSYVIKRMEEGKDKD